MEHKLNLKDKAEHLIKILVDNMIDDAEVVAEAIWDLFIPEPFPSLDEGNGDFYYTEWSDSYYTEWEEE